MIRVLFLCVLLAPLTLEAQPHHKGPKPHELLIEHADELGLTPEVIEQIKEIAENARPLVREIRESLRENRGTLKGLLRQDSPDEEAVMEAVRIVGESRISQEQHKLQVLLRIRRLLNSEQREKLMELMPKRGPKGERRRRGPGPGHREGRR